MIAPLASHSTQHDAGGGDELDGGPQRGLDPQLLRGQRADAVDLLAMARRLLRLARERLDRRQHAEVLLGDRDRGRVLLAQLRRERPDAAAEDLEQQEEQRDERTPRAARAMGSRRNMKNTAPATVNSSGTIASAVPLT